MAGTAVHADLADNGKDQVLGRNTSRQAPGDVDRKRPRLPLQQALRGEHVTDLGRADTEGEGTECAVRARVAIPADDRLARLAGAEFRADDMHYSALLATETVQIDTEVLAVLFHLPNLVGGAFAHHGKVAKTSYRRGRRGVIHRCEYQVRASYRESPLPKEGESLRRRDLMNEVQVDVKNGGGRRRFRNHDVFRPHLPEQRFGFCQRHRFLAVRWWHAKHRLVRNAVQRRSVACAIPG